MTIYSLDILLSQFGTVVGSNCCLLICIQVSQEAIKVAGIPISLRIFHSLLWSTEFVVIHTVKGVSLVDEAEVDVFLEFSCFFCDPTDGNLISGFSAFSKSRLNIWKFSVHVPLKPGLENFEHYFASLLWGGSIVLLTRRTSSYYVPSGLTELTATDTLRPVLPPFQSSQHPHTNRLGFF